MSNHGDPHSVKLPGQAGAEFQRATRYSRHAMSPHWLDWEHVPATYKLYHDVPVLPLPTPSIMSYGKPDGERNPAPDLWSCISRRRSTRSFGREPMSSLELSDLLWASTGITGGDSFMFLRSAPSAGALFPIETYVVAHRVEGIEPGVYHYRLVGVDAGGRATSAGGHALEQLVARDVKRRCAACALDQDMAAEAAVVFVWTAVVARSTWKYRQRAYRYIYLDAGHIAQNLLLAAVALGLSACPIAAFYDDEVEELLGLDGENEPPLYMVVVGKQ